MRSFGKFLLITVVALVVVFVVGVSLTIGWRPFLGPKARPLTSRTFERTPQRLERGRYLASAVSGCLGCHSEHDWKNTGEILPGMEGSGEVMPIADLPGRIVAPNLTPDKETGAGSWTDDQLARAIREGIGHDGRALFPMMPYRNFRVLSDEDVASIVVFLRSLSPVRHALPKTEIIFPVKYLIRSAPQPITTPVASTDDPSDPVRHGEFLVRIADCNGCHTPQSRGQEVPGMRLAGGFVLDGPWGHVVSANITPDASGISYYDEALFMKVLHTGYVGARKLAPIMPVSEYKNMTDEDMKAIFAYLRTVKPVKHRVGNSETLVQATQQ